MTHDHVVFARISDEPVGSGDCAKAVESDAAGAVVDFAGVVRNHDEGRDVRALRYSAHPSAQAEIERLAAEVAAQFPQVTIAVVHRTGDLAIGDIALGCAVASAHRGEAFAACSLLVDTLKKNLPIWKRQVFADGTDEWVAALG
ncbi:MAG: molybdenum cofactor biosynthesis protein MoaE [Microbacteriaceae bacterium]